MSSHTRFAELMSKVLDDVISDEEIIELHTLVDADPSLRSQLVDHLLLDTLLEENLGQEPLTALVDLVGDSTGTLTSPSPVLAKERTHVEASTKMTGRPWSWMSGWLALAASLLVVVSIFTLQGNREAFASASQIVQSAMRTHAAPIERIYVVEVKRGESNKSKFELPRDVRVATQGDRFWVQMRGYRDWAWGRNDQGAIWMTLGPRRAVVVNQDEIGVPLRYIGDLYTLNLETLLQGFLKYCRLEMSEGPVDTTIIVATPRRQWTNRPLQRATIEVDRETKAIRKLVIEREFGGDSYCTVTFSLVDSRLADESEYAVEGHLQEKSQLFADDTPTSAKRKMVLDWFGPVADRWILATPEADIQQQLSEESVTALKARVDLLFISLLKGDVGSCVKLTDPQILKEKGASQVAAYFRSVSVLIRTSKITRSDRRIVAVVSMDQGSRARVDIQVTLDGVDQPLGFEIWRLIDGQWYYQETPK